MYPDPLRIASGIEEEDELSVVGRRTGRGGAGPETGECASSSATTGALEEMERGGIGGGGPNTSLSLSTRLKVPDELALDLPMDD